MDRRRVLERICREQCVLALYLFGSRADDGLRLLAGEEVEPAGSTLGLGVLFTAEPSELKRFKALESQLCVLFDPLRLELVPLQRVEDTFFQARAIDGHRVVAIDSTRADLWELAVMRMAGELLVIKENLESHASS